MTYDELHDLCRQRGYARKASKAEVKTCLAKTDAVDRKNKIDEEGVMGTAETLPGKRDHASADAPENKEELSWHSGDQLPRGRSSLGLPCVQESSVWGIPSGGMLI